MKTIRLLTILILMLLAMSQAKSNDMPLKQRVNGYEVLVEYQGKEYRIFDKIKSKGSIIYVVKRNGRKYTIFCQRGKTQIYKKTLFKGYQQRKNYLYF